MSIEVTIIVPMRNEEKYLEYLINSIVNQTYPKEKLEVLLVDGMSEDRTKEIAERYIKKYPFLQLLENPKRIVSTALNIGIRKAKGEFIIVMSAHSFYGHNYVARCIQTLRKTGADVVGGPIITLPAGSSRIARSIAIATSNPFGVGNSKFRTSKESGYVDTVAFGAYRKRIFDKVGLFDERLIRNQDIELNSRIRRSGGKIYLNANIKSYYYNRSTLKGLWIQNFRNGEWNINTIQVNRRALSLRHFVPLAFVSVLLGGLILSPFFIIARYFLLFVVISYLFASFFFSLCAVNKQNFNCLPFLPITYFVLHISYGLGSIWGLLNLKKNEATASKPA